MKKWFQSLLISCLCLGVADAQTSPRGVPLGTLYALPDGTVYSKPTKKRPDTLFLKTSPDGTLVARPNALKKWPGALTVTVNVNATEGYFNAQGQTQGLPLDGTAFRYTIDGGLSWKNEAWAWRLSPGTYTVRCEFNRPGYVLGVAEKQFVIPGKPSGQNLPTEPKPSGGTPKPADDKKSDQAGTFYTLPQPGAKRLHYVPRLVIPPSTATNQVRWNLIPEFTLSSWFTMVYWDIPPLRADSAFARGWGYLFPGKGVVGKRAAVVVYANVLGDSPWRNRLYDAGEVASLRSKIVGYVAGQRALSADGEAPALVMTDFENRVQDSQKASEGPYESSRGQMHQAVKDAFPASRVGLYGIDYYGWENDPCEIIGGWYSVLNVWVPAWQRFLEAPENPVAYTDARNVWAEWSYERVMEAKKARKWREGGGKQLLTASWSRLRDGSNSAGQLVTMRDDIAEGEVLLSLLGGSQGIGVWNAHRCTTPNCDPLSDCGSDLKPTDVRNATLWRLHHLNALFDGNQRYALPSYSLDGTTFKQARDEFGGGAQPPAYSAFRAKHNMEFWAYDAGDDEPLILAVLNGSEVGIVAGFPRETDPTKRHTFQVRVEGLIDEPVTTEGREWTVVTTLPVE